MKKDNSKVAGGVARAQALDPEKRRQIAAKAARKRWSGSDLPVAEFGSVDRPLRILDVEIPCYVLSDGTRVLTQDGFLKAIGRSGRPKGGTGARSAALDNAPSFLFAANLKPLITEEFLRSTMPVEFKVEGITAYGYRAELLPQVCNLYLRARDQKMLHYTQEHVAKRADMLVRGLAETGIVALVDEATGYQSVRARDALQAYLDKFLRKELAAWVKTFPDEFFEQLFRLKKWKWTGTSRRPGVVGHYINDLVYERLGPGVLDELNRRNPTNERGQRKAKHFQWLTEEIGHPALASHMYAIIGFMRAHDDWNEFKHQFTKAFPKKGENLSLLM
ncbi:P63C domain-containing protein [Cupriavidus numazuensis]|uniref:Bacteriophage Mx8 p63 C-terminal domain-containing protein n=1 Tax=Cupriavidus numazuensis TaxID=221992 RepID=A0ABN7PSK7_9BURK|nr:P63C domain-containing protein [Cupriavidus numazuensis]CAG2132409.1 hypothetical protein LMG26411_00613 [Cupriavidus numazuensis]